MPVLPSPAPAQPLVLDHLLWRMSRVHPRSQVVTSGHVPSRLSFGDLADRARSLAASLVRAGVGEGDVVATMAWNTCEHLEAMLAVPLIGGVLDAVNPRLEPRALSTLLREPPPRALLVDAGMLDAADPVGRVVRDVVLQVAADGAVVIVIGGAPASSSAAVPAAVGYEELLGRGAAGTAPPAVPLPAVPEDAPAFWIHTGGTTGLPKSYVVTHRAAMLHALAQSGVDASGLSRTDRLLALAPLFHVGSWGLPFTALLTGASLVLPGRDLSAASITRLLVEEDVTVAAGVPTVWYDVVQHVRRHGGAPTTLREVITGGSPVPASLVEGIRTDLGAGVATAWGMTETMACTTYERELPAERVGRPVPLAELRVVRGDEIPSPADGSGVVEVRGPFVVGTPQIGDDEQGWVSTGDVAALDGEGRLQIQGRLKDLIKSGGEWIPAAALEERIGSHPAVSLVAVVPAPHPRWMERPVAYVTVLAGRQCSADDLLEYLRPLVPRWWLPDRICVVEELPRTGVGKIDKTRIRAWASRAEAADSKGQHP